MRSQDKAQLATALVDARRLTHALLDDLSDRQWIVPQWPIVNPFLWEYGHVGWFMENFCLRRRQGSPPRPSLLADADRWYDSSSVAHDSRWSLDMPERARTASYLSQVLELTLAALDRTDESDQSSYRFRLALYHECMHAEAFAYMRHTLGLPRPEVIEETAPAATGSGDVPVAGGVFLLGAPKGRGFVFDNEKWSHEVRMAPFAIAGELVTNGQYAAFIAEHGYTRDEFWSAEGLAWRATTGRTAPRDWRKTDTGWQERRYDRWQPLDSSTPVTHVTAFEAEAYCRWAGRRLPSEPEWECAAVAGAIAPRGLWEWTSSMFAPFAGFAADDYADYSQPWFHTHRVLRGASFATPAPLVHPRFRNFYKPDRDDIFVGFRTCAL